MSRSYRIRIDGSALPTPIDMLVAIHSLGHKLNAEGLALADARADHGCILDGEDAGFTVKQVHDSTPLVLRYAQRVRSADCRGCAAKLKWRRSQYRCRCDD